MRQRSIRELDSLPDRIKLHRQADQRGILVVEGPSDERFIQRLAPGRWALFRAGTRNVVISTINEVVTLRVDRVAGLVDRDFDDVALSARERGLPIYWYDNADLEGFLFLGPAFDNMIEELSSEQKLKTYGGISVIREKAVAVAVEIAVLRTENSANKWGLPFDSIDLSKKIDRDTLSLKRTSYCQALAESDYVHVQHNSLHKAINAGLEDRESRTSRDIFFSGKDALVVVGVALKTKIGSCDSGVTKNEHLAGVLRLSAPVELIDLPPFSDIGHLIDISRE